MLMAVMMILSLFSTTVLAAQPTAYRDPAEHWMSAGNRTSELDVNAVTTKESFPCYACGQTTSFTVWRTPEYTKDGKSSLTHNVLYSDGTSVDGQNTGSVLMGKPGVDSTYTGYHWTKSCCDVCGTLNGNTSTSLYGFGKNVYILYDCAVGFIEDLDEQVSYEPADSTYHTKIVDGGDYCQFCFGTHHTHSSSLEKHSFDIKVLAQLDKQRFAIVKKCGVCGYTETEYVAAKCVVANYYGKVDGQAHTLLISDLSESGVRTEIRYGDSANNCTQATPPSYTEEGQYTVYYQVTYTYENTEMTENGVAYVWLHDETAMDPAHGFPGYDPHDHDPTAPGNTVHHTINIGVDSPLHQYTFLDTVAPTCSTLGYDRYLCPICGAIELRNYVQAKEHTYQTVVIRDADCEHEGKTLKICHSCGEVEEIITPKVEHHYTITTIPATCTDPGYTVKECSVCGDRIITNITAVKGHTFISTVAAPTCTTGGHTHHVCKDCGESYLDSYTEALGHRWDDGTVIKTPTCTETGLIEYRCLNCGVTKLEELNGDGSHSGLSATVQVNNTVNAGHHYSSDVTQPTCDKMGYTTYTCVDCGDSYKGDYTDPTGHNYKTAVTKPTCTTLGYTTYTCASCGDSYKSDYVELLGHNYKAFVTAPTCTEGGYTTFTCSRCGDSYVANYTAALGHDWKKPVTLADSTCNSEGVLEYDCSRCDAHYHEAISAKGHNPGPAATCSTPQTCKDCGAILAPATEHSYKTVVTQPTCEKMGYTTYTCTSCENSYKGDYVEILGHDYKGVVTAPTCTEGGYTTYTCTRCGDSYVDDHTDPLGHDWKGPETLADSTCSSDGVNEYNCSRCNAHYHEAISAKGHKPGPAATCDNPQTCQDCGAVLAPATGHSYKKTVTKPTCTKMGYTTYTCSGCGDSYKSDYTELLGHNYEAVITEPTCKEGGYTTFTCSRCGDSYVSDYTDPLGHDWQEPELLADSTCGSEGILEYSCSRCEAHYHEAVSAKGHNPGPAATCVNPQTCLDCGAVLAPATDHSYEAVVTDPVCTRMGYTTYTCANCGDSYKSDYLEMLGHDYTAEITPPTCTEGGFTTFTCNRCGDSYVSDYTDPLGHAWKDPVTLDDSTCNSDGVNLYECARCDAHYYEAISAKGHKPGPAATCINPQTCKDCGAVLAPATGHHFKADVTAPTCLEMGYTTYICSCGESYKSEYTHMLGHDYEAVVTEPTCTEGGYSTYTCSRCEDSYVSDETDPLGHDWDKGTKIADASCKSEGVLEHHCKRCEEKYLEAISAKGHNPGPAATCTDPQLCKDCGAVLNPPIGHSYKSETTAPTCTEMGFTTYTCDKCGDSYKADYTNPTGHQYSDWIMDREPTMDEEGQRHQVCTNCGTVLITEKLEKLYRIATTDSKGEAVVNGYLVIVTDTKTKDPVSNATVLWNEDGTITVRLPDGRTLDYGKDTTVLVLVGEEKDPVRDLVIKITDNSGNYASDKTNDKGEVTLPGEDGKSGDEGSVTVGGKDADADPFTITVNVIDGKNNRPIDDANVTIGKTGTITVVLPDGRDIDDNNPIIIKVTDQNGNPITDRLVIIKGDKDKETGRTNEEGTLTVPEAEVTEFHGIYILGYPDGTFGPARQMTRAEAAAIFARLLAEKKDDTIPTAATTKFSDVSANDWYSGYVKYLSNFGVIYGTGEDTFDPNRAITRAEFVAMAVRFFDNYGDGNAEIMEQYVEFSDVSSGYWAAKYIKDAAIHGWIKGYEDGTFRADRNIARCEVVAIVNRLLDRVADQDYVDSHLRSLNTFTDMKKDHWAYYEVMESANAHTAHLNGSETWSK